MALDFSLGLWGPLTHSHRIRTPFPQDPKTLNSGIPHFDSKAQQSAPNPLIWDITGP